VATSSQRDTNLRLRTDSVGAFGRTYGGIHRRSPSASAEGSTAPRFRRVSRPTASAAGRADDDRFGDRASVARNLFLVGETFALAQRFSCGTEPPATDLFGGASTGSDGSGPRTVYRPEVTLEGMKAHGRTGRHAAGNGGRTLRTHGRSKATKPTTPSDSSKEPGNRDRADPNATKTASSSSDEPAAPGKRVAVGPDADAERCRAAVSESNGKAATTTATWNG